MKQERQLWLATSPDFILPGGAGKGGASRWAAPGLRMLFWPSGQVCWEANAYLIWMRKQGRQISSIKTYASEISLILRFLEKVNVRLLDVNDEILIDFADWLQKRKKSSGRHINRILLRAIEMLNWLQRLIARRPLVAEAGRGAQISIAITTVNVQGALRSSIRHPAMMPPEPRRIVHPASLDVLKALMGACDKSAKTSFFISRNRAILLLLADCGIRREELVWVKCADILKALKEGKGIEIRTSKRSGNPKRVVPIPEETLRHLSCYLEVHRALRVRRLRRRDPTFTDEDWAFCTRTGGQMAPATVTQLFSDLRALAGISERATAHMLRHRYITLQVVHRLKMLRSSRSIGVEALSTILSRVASLSGHARLSSLWTYVDWAYDEISIDSASPMQINEALESVQEVIAKFEISDDMEVLTLLKKVEAVLQNTDSSMSAVQSVIAHSCRRST